MELHRPVYNAKRIEEALTELQQGTKNAVLNQEDYDDLKGFLAGINPDWRISPLLRAR